MRAQLYLIRHGKTSGNLQRRYVGVTDEPLCTEGIRELEAFRVCLKRRFVMEELAMPEYFFVSPMLRCRQSAALLLADAKPCVIEDFREMDFGEFEYKNYDELAGDKRYQAFIDSGGRLDFPGAETREHFCGRVKRAFERCAARIFDNVEASMADGPEKPYLFCVHGGTIMAILDAYSAPHRDYFEWQVPNASGFCGVLEMENNGIYLKNIEKLS